MAAIASIKFDQADGSSSSAGQAHKAVLYAAPDLAKNVITVTNGDNTDVAAWKIELLHNPPGSVLGAVPGTPVILAQATSSTPSANFTIDAPDGCYRIRMTVWSAGGLSNIDIRNVGVPNERGVITPPYQKLPDPLPVLGSGISGEKPDELNFSGQLYGWLGDSGAGLHYDFFKLYDDLPLVEVTTASYTAKARGEKPLYVVNLTTIAADAVFNLPTSGWRTGQRFRVAAFGGAAYKLTVNAPAGHTINGLSSIVMKSPNSAVFVYTGGTSWVMLGAKYDIYERSIVAGEESVDVIGFQSVGTSCLIDPASFPNCNSSATWAVVIETTDALDSAEIRLFNVTLGSAVAGSTLTTANLTPTVLSSTVTLASGPNLYEAQLRLATTGAPNQATCRQAQLAISWLQP